MVRFNTGEARWAEDSRRVAILPVVLGWLILLVANPPVLGFYQLPPTVKVYFDSSHSADALLRSAENHVRAGDYAEAIGIYERISQLYGDKVVEIQSDAGGPETRLSINARRESQRRIAALPPEARALYRARTDAQAELLYRQGLENRDRGALRRVVDQAFCSSWGDDALDLLGDLAFQSGQFTEALEAYEQLIPDRPLGGAGLVHPDPSIDRTRVEAKKLLCRAAIGEHSPTTDELAAFARSHPAEITTFAGRRGPIASDLVAAVRDDHLGPPAQEDGRWPTFAGSFTRSRIAPGPIDVGSLQWRVSLTPVEISRNQFRQRSSGLNPSSDRLLAYHPIIIGDQVLVANDRGITAYDLNVRPGDPSLAGVAHGEIAWQTTPDQAIAQTASRVITGLPRYTLTAVGHRVYARLGPPAGSNLSFNRMGAPTPARTPSLVVAVDRSSEGKLLWKSIATEIPLPKRPHNDKSPAAVFEGSPVADAHSVYVAVTDRVEMTASYVVCLDANTGDTRWIRYICEANANNDPISPTFEIAHRLLTLAGSTLYYQTNLGALAALDTETGSVRWLATYPWAGRGGIGGFNGFGMMGGGGATPTQQRDLNPAIAHEGLVIIAPDETPRIFAFNSTTGELVWKSEVIPDEVKLSHLLGVAKGQLIATGDRVHWFDVKTGQQTHVFPDKPQVATGYGRGLLAGDRIYWPTKTEIHILDQASGLRADAPIRLDQAYGVEGGNLAVGDGYLVVAQANSMVVFCQNSRLIERYRDEIARDPEDALNYFRLAQAAEATGRDDLALESLDLALPRARTSETIDGTPLVEATREHRCRLLMKLGEKAKLAKNWPEATRRYDEVGQTAPMDRERLAARLELAEIQLASGDWLGSVRTWQALLGDESLRALTVDAPDGHRTVRAELLIIDRLNALLQAHGQELYAEFDAAANDLLTRGKARQEPRLLEDLGRHYPSARVVPEALQSLGALYDRLNRPADAARTYKRQLAIATDDATRARALWGLARAYEAQKLWVSARETYLQASARQPSIVLDDPPGPLAAAVAARLGQSPFHKMGGDHGEPSVAVPLWRLWDHRWQGASKLITADGTPPSAESARIFLAQAGSIRPVDQRTGESRWSRDLQGDATWVGYLADRVIAATPSRIVALNLLDGTVDWQFNIADDAVARGDADPFPHEPVDRAHDSLGAGSLAGFRLVGNRVFCLRGNQTLLAFDGDTGQIDWSYTTPTGRINPRLHIGTGRIALQLRDPNSVLILETPTGRRHAEFVRADAEKWLRDPISVDDDHIAVVVDRLSVALFNLDRGTSSWVFKESSQLPVNGPPRLFGDGNRLFVLQDGQELIRLDPITGAKLWARPLGSEDLSERPEAFAFGEDRVFIASEPSLSAIRINDGTTAWKRPLNGPAKGWAVVLTDRSVAAYPAPERMDKHEGATFPLLIRRRDDGDLIQRLQFPTSSADLAVRFSPRGVLIATSTAAWGLGDRPGMDDARPDR